MSRRSEGTLEGLVARLRERAAAFADARRSLRERSTPAIERAALRRIGVHGLDGAGQPLAASVVERARAVPLGDGPDAIVLPLAGAAAASSLGAREAASMVGEGSLDLAVADALLQDPARLAMARSVLAEWRAESDERIDATRTARHELGDTLGRPPAPMAGALLRAYDLDGAVAEARLLVEAGVDALVVRVPRGRELLGSAGRQGEERLPADLDPPPAGSQRGLARLRAALDEMAAERRRSLVLGTASEPLAAPEQALVAAFEGVDLVFADPIEEVAAGVGLERALTDHAAAHALLARSGALLVVSAGPLIAGPELARGEDVPARTRIARSIAAQAASLAWATASGLGPDRVLAQAPFEVTGSRSEGPLLAAAILVRQALHVGHGLVLTEPPGLLGDAWRADLPVALLAAPDARLVLHAAEPAEIVRRVADTRAAAALAGRLPELLAGGSAGRLEFAPALVALARDLATEALATFDEAERDGWEALAGGALAATGATMISNDERTAMLTHGTPA